MVVTDNVRQATKKLSIKLLASEEAMPVGLEISARYAADVADG